MRCLYIEGLSRENEGDFFLIFFKEFVLECKKNNIFAVPNQFGGKTESVLSLK